MLLETVRVERAPIHERQGGTLLETVTVERAQPAQGDEHQEGPERASAQGTSREEAGFDVIIRVYRCRHGVGAGSREQGAGSR